MGDCRREALTWDTVEYLLVDEHAAERVRWTIRKDGCVREQGCNIQAGRDDYWGCNNAMVSMGVVRLSGGDSLGITGV